MQGEARGQAGELVAARVTQARPTLKADQREMVRRLLSDPEGIAVVVGEAGTGKTFAIVAAAEGWAQAGYELRAVAPTWRAANVLRAEGLEATSVARLLAQMDGGDGAEADSSLLSPRTVLLVDEAGMVGSAELAALIDAADRRRRSSSWSATTSSSARSRRAGSTAPWPSEATRSSWTR